MALVAPSRPLQTFEKVRLLIFGMGVTLFRVRNPDFNRILHDLHQTHPLILSEFKGCYKLLDYPIHDEFDRCFQDLTHEPNWPPAFWWKPVLDEERDYTTGFMILWEEAEKEVRRIFMRSPKETASLLDLAAVMRKSLDLEPDLTWIVCEDDLHAIWMR